MIEIISLIAVCSSCKAGSILTGKNLKVIVYIICRTIPLSGGHGYVLIGHLLEEAVILLSYTRFENITVVEILLNSAAFPDIANIRVVLRLDGRSVIAGKNEGYSVAVAGEIDIQNTGAVGTDGYRVG